MYSVKIFLCAAVVFLFDLILSGQTQAADYTDVVQTFDHGHINWSKGLLISSGVAAPPAKKEVKEPQAFEDGLAQAHTLALEHMRDMVLNTRIDSPNLVGSIAAANDVMMTKVESLVKSARERC